MPRLCRRGDGCFSAGKSNLNCQMQVHCTETFVRCSQSPTAQTSVRVTKLRSTRHLHTPHISAQNTGRKAARLRSVRHTEDPGYLAHGGPPLQAPSKLTLSFTFSHRSTGSEQCNTYCLNSNADSAHKKAQDHLPAPAAT